MNAPDTLKHASGAVEPRAYEPSMEEILASIRRIIADDQSMPGRVTAREADVGSRLGNEAQPRPLPEPHPAASGSPEPSKQDKPPFLRGPSDHAAVVFRHPASQGETAEPVSAKEAPAAKIDPAPQRAAASQGSGHIAAPQFAMPDAPVTRQAPAQTRDDTNDSDASLLRFAPSQAAAGEQNPFTQARPVPDRAAHEDGPQARVQQTSIPTPELFSAETSKSVTESFNRLAAIRLAENDEMLKGLAREMLRPLLKDWLDANLPDMVERLVRAEIERVGRGGR